jgi:hypothetical protein
MPLKGHSPNAISEGIKRGLELAYEVASSIFQMDKPYRGQAVYGGRCRSRQG